MDTWSDRMHFSQCCMAPAPLGGHLSFNVDRLTCMSHTNRAALEKVHRRQLQATPMCKQAQWQCGAHSIHLHHPEQMRFSVSALRHGCLFCTLDCAKRKPIGITLLQEEHRAATPSMGAASTRASQCWSNPIAGSGTTWIGPYIFLPTNLDRK
jgi:hypothetical protein